MSSIRRLMAGMDNERSKYRPYVNTGGSLDILNGKYIPTMDGGWCLSGGLGHTTAVISEANRFKSTLLNGWMINACARFPDSQGYLLDSEGSLDAVRLVRMSDRYLDEPEKRTKHLSNLSERIMLYDNTTNVGENLESWFDFMKEVRDEKVKHFKDYEFETEIMDPDTGNPYVMILPTFFGIDSWSQAKVKHVIARNEDFDADTEMKEQRTIHLDEGWQKARLMEELPRLCAKGGFYTTLTGHVGKKMSIDGKPVPKDLPNMGQGKTVKGMSNKFYFLMNTIIEILNNEMLADKQDRKQSEYPAEQHVAGNELQQMTILYLRGKNSPDGAITQLVSSKTFGIMTALSYYNHLRNNKYFGLGSPNKMRSPLLGDLNIGRTKIFDLSNEYKIGRALELTNQLFTIQSSWTLVDQPVDYSISLETFVDKLNGKGYAIDDILNSRGWWTYNEAAKKEDRPYLTLPDILAMVDGTYKPKWWPVK